MAVFAPIPSASVNMATTVNPGFFPRIRRANFKSCQRLFIFLSQTINDGIFKWRACPIRTSLIAQDNDRIDACGAPRWKVASQEGNSTEDERGGAEHQRICRTYTEEQASKQTR